MAPFDPRNIDLPRLVPRARARLDRLGFREAGTLAAKTRQDQLKKEIAKLRAEEDTLKQKLEKMRDKYLSRTEIEETERNFLHISYKAKVMSARTQDLCKQVGEQIDSTKRALVEALAPRAIADVGSGRSTKDLNKSTKKLREIKRELRLTTLKSSLLADDIKDREEKMAAVQKELEKPQSVVQSEEVSEESSSPEESEPESETESESELEPEPQEPTIEPKADNREINGSVPTNIVEHVTAEIVPNEEQETLEDSDAKQDHVDTEPQPHPDADPVDHEDLDGLEEDTVRTLHNDNSLGTEKDDFQSLKEEGISPKDHALDETISIEKDMSATRDVTEGDEKKETAGDKHVRVVIVEQGIPLAEISEGGDKLGMIQEAVKLDKDGKGHGKSRSRRKLARKAEEERKRKEKKHDERQKQIAKKKEVLEILETDCAKFKEKKEILESQVVVLQQRVERLQQETTRLAQTEKEQGREDAENEYDKQWRLKRKEEQKQEIQDLERQKEREKALELARRESKKAGHRASRASRAIRARQMRWRVYYYESTTDSDGDEPEFSEEGHMQSLRKVIDGVESLEEKIREVRKLSEEVDSKADLRVVLERELDLESWWLEEVDTQTTASATTEVKSLAARQQRDHFSNSLTEKDLKFYKKLEPNEIRLLVVWPAPADHYPLLCSLDISKWEEGRSVPEYAALSYNWGDDACNGRLYLVLEDGPTSSTEPSTWGSTARYALRIPIRNNLFRALLRLRRDDKPVHLWVDVVCINQANLVEKTEQLEQLIKIYQKAKNVCIWLGESDNLGRSDEAMDFITSIMDFAVLDRYAKDSKQAGKWHCLAELMRDRWFSRRWVVQEVSLARAATVHCGGKMVQWLDFADAVSLLASNQETIANLFDYKEWRDGPKTLGDVQSFGAYILLEATSKLFLRTAKGDNITRPVKKLEALVTSLKTFDATDKKDLIYSLVSIASDTPQSANIYKLGEKTADLKVDYRKDSVEVYKDFTRFCIESSQSLDILCRPWAMKIDPPKFPLPALPAPKLPSWIPLLSDSEFGTPDEVYSGRKNGENLVGPVDRPHYKAHGEASKYEKKDLKDILGTKHLSNQNLLPLRGFKLARITTISPRNTGGVILRESLVMGGWNRTEQDASGIVPDKIWRTLVADRDPDGQIPPTWYQRACLRCLEIADTFNNGDLNVGELLQGNSELIRKYLTRVKNVTWNRRFFQATTERDRSATTGRSSHFAPNTKTTDGGGTEMTHHEHQLESPIEHARLPAFQRENDGTDNDCDRPRHERRYSTTGGANGFLPENGNHSGSNGGGDSKKPSPLFGLGPPTMEAGDYICILKGCSVPVILRQIPPAGTNSSETSPPDQDTHMMFIGEAYVHGKMEGEAVEDQKMGQALGQKWEIFYVE